MPNHAKHYHPAANNGCFSQGRVSEQSILTTDRIREVCGMRVRLGLQSIGSHRLDTDGIQNLKHKMRLTIPEPQDLNLKYQQHF